MPNEVREIHPYLTQNEFSLDDLVFPPGRIPNFNPSEVDYSANLTKRIRLKRPVIGSPMDSVTESRMAILLARMGGIGVIHAGLSIERQILEIEKVRRWEAGFVLKPHVLGPDATVGDVLAGERISISSFPITQDGTLETPIVGIVTGRDVRDLRSPDQQMMLVSEVMTPREKLHFGKREDTLDLNNIRAANAIIRTYGVDTLPILDSEDKVVALVTRSDMKKNTDNPLATKDDNNQLKVLAAVTSRFLPARERIAAIAHTGISGIVIDSRNIYADYLPIAKFAKEQNPDLDVIIGNIVHPDVLLQVLEEAGSFVDAFRVGIGTGEVCITAEELGVSRAMGSTFLELDPFMQQAKDKYGFIGLMVDGGVKYPKHFLAGAMLNRNFAGVMMGTYLGGFDESPALKIEKKPGVFVKRVRGMGSEAAITERAGGSRYGVDDEDPSERFPEGIEKEVPAVGPGESIIKRYFQGVRTGMHALGADNIERLYQGAKLYPVAKAASKGTLSAIY